MANIAGSGYTSPYTSPTFKYDIAYSEIARNASSVTYRFYIDVYMTSTSSSFGYSLAGYIDVNGAVSYVTFKGTEKWTGTTVHSFQVDVTAPAGSGGGTLNAHFNAYRPGGEGNSGKIDVYGTVNLSTWNTAPSWPTGAACTVSPSGTIPENTASLTVSWAAANDTEGNTRYYTVKRYKNGSYDATIATNITATSVSDNIGSGNQGASYYYTVEVNDGSLTQSAKLQSATVTKNTFTGASITTGGNILYSTSTLAMTISGAKNTNGNTLFTYSLACDKVTVYNPTASPGNVTIYKSGALPTGTYIKFDDIKTALAGSGYKGNFVFTLTTTNAYGSTKTSTVTVYVDITTTPTAVGAIFTTGTFNIGGTEYFVPGKKDITVTWGASSDPLGGSITYELQGKIGYDNFVTLATGITGNSKTVSLAAVTAQTFYTFRVVAKTSYGTSVVRDAVEITLHYYYTPSVIFDPIVRNVNDAIISGEIKLNTSIPGVTVSALSYTGKSSGTLTLATTFTKQETGLLETDTFNFSVTVRDTAGDVINGSTGVTFSKSVQRYAPTLSVRKKGIGINALADDTYIFAVGGKSKFSDDVVSKGFFNNIKLTTGAGASYQNQWTKIATLKVGAQYADSYLRVQLANSIDGNSYSESMTLYARIKQQTAMGTVPYVDINVFNNRNLPASNIKGVLIENSASLTQLDIYIKNPALYRAYAIYPMDKYGTVEIYESQGYVSTLPTGTQFSCNSGIFEEGVLLSDKYSPIHAHPYAPSGYGLGGLATRLANNYDLNNLVNNGWYDCYAPTNGPFGANWTKIFQICSADAAYISQMAVSMTHANNVVVMRQKNNGVWTAWNTIYSGVPTNYVNSEMNNNPNGIAIGTKYFGSASGAFVANPVVNNRYLLHSGGASPTYLAQIMYLSGTCEVKIDATAVIQQSFVGSYYIRIVIKTGTAYGTGTTVLTGNETVMTGSSAGSWYNVPCHIIGRLASGTYTAWVEYRPAESFTGAVYTAATTLNTMIFS